MTRSIGSNFNTQITSGQVQPFMAVSLGFSTPLNLWTGYHDITIGSDTYVGGGNLLEISSIQESSEVKATGMSIALSGLDSSIVSSAVPDRDWET